MELAKIEELKNNSLKRLSEIKEYNKLVSCLTPFLKKTFRASIIDLKEKNEAADILSIEFQKSFDIKDYYKFFNFWVYENCAREYEDGTLYQSTLFLKSDLILKGLLNGINPPELKDLRSFSQKYNSNRNNYIYELESALIVTAVPTEFIAIARKMSEILTTSNKDYLAELLDTDTPLAKKNDKDLRKPLTITGILNLNDKVCKVRILLPKEYGSIASMGFLSNFLKPYYYNNEILLVGIAGQLEKTSKVKVGHLVISDGFYDAYFQKVGKDGINFQNTEPIPLSDDYEVNGFDWCNWQPRNFFADKPDIPVGHEPKRYCYSKTVHKGKFVSFHAVNKQKDFKGQLLHTFDESLAVEMEGTGCYKFIQEHQNHLELKIIKAVCDWSDETKSKEWQPYCAELAAEFTVDYLINKYGE